MSCGVAHYIDYGYSRVDYSMIGGGVTALIVLWWWCGVFSLEGILRSCGWV